MNIRPDIGVVSGTIFFQITSDGFLGFMSKTAKALQNQTKPLLGHFFTQLNMLLTSCAPGLIYVWLLLIIIIISQLRVRKGYRHQIFCFLFQSQ